jgi:hypothetical protein
MHGTFPLGSKDLGQMVARHHQPPGQLNFQNLVPSDVLHCIKNLTCLAAVCMSPLVCSAGAQATAARWTLADPLVRVIYRLDAQENRKLGRYLEYWVTVDFDYAPQFDTARPYRSARILRRADCVAGTQDTVSILQFDAAMGQGNLLWASMVDDETLRMEPAAPESVAAMLLSWACSGAD